MENILLFALTVICGVIGAKTATNVMKILSLGTALNLSIGIIGGISGIVLANFFDIPLAANLAYTSGILNSAIAAGLGGAILMTLVGVLKVSFTQESKHKSDKHYA